MATIPYGLSLGGEGWINLPIDMAVKGKFLALASAVNGQSSPLVSLSVKAG